jgi:hypothetical protein
MRGSGAVRDLREAAQLSPELAIKLAGLVSSGHITRTEFLEKPATIRWTAGRAMTCWMVARVMTFT